MKNLTVILILLAAVFSRLIPHPPNVTAVTALALLGGAYILPRSLAVFIPVLALLISDLALGFHSTMFFVYAATGMIALVATGTLRKSLSWSRILVGSVSASLFFFAVTNFGVWLVDSLYPQTAAGLVQCFVMALPFLGNQVVGDLLYVTALFGILEIVKTLKPELAKA